MFKSLSTHPRNAGAPTNEHHHQHWQVWLPWVFALAAMASIVGAFLVHLFSEPTGAEDDERSDVEQGDGYLAADGCDADQVLRWTFPPKEDREARRRRWARVLRSKPRPARPAVQPLAPSDHLSVDAVISAFARSEHASTSSCDSGVSNGNDASYHAGLSAPLSSPALRDRDATFPGGPRPVGSPRQPSAPVGQSSPAPHPKLRDRVRDRILNLLLEAGPSKTLCAITEERSAAAAAAAAAADYTSHLRRSSSSAFGECEERAESPEAQLLPRCASASQVSEDPAAFPGGSHGDPIRSRGADRSHSAYLSIAEPYPAGAQRCQSSCEWNTTTPPPSPAPAKDSGAVRDFCSCSRNDECCCAPPNPLLLDGEPILTVGPGGRPVTRELLWAALARVQQNQQHQQREQLQR